MWDMNEVTKVEYRGEYVYHILFDDGLQGEIDFSVYLSREASLSRLRTGPFSPGRPWRVAPLPGQTGLTLPPRRSMRNYSMAASRTSGHAKSRVLPGSDLRPRKPSKRLYRDLTPIYESMSMVGFCPGKPLELPQGPRNHETIYVHFPIYLQSRISF